MNNERNINVNLASPDFPQLSPVFNRPSGGGGNGVSFSGFGDSFNLFGGWDVSGFFLVLKVIMAIFIVGALAFAVYVYIMQQEERQERDNWMKKYVNDQQANYNKIPKTRWGHVQALFQSKNQGDWRMAVIEADSMLDDLLVRLGYQGNTLGERLKSTDPRNFPKRDMAWKAHLIRNKIAHEGSQFKLSHMQALRVMRWYEDVFRHSRYIR